MRDLFEPQINRFRRTSFDVIEVYGNTGDGYSGVFDIPNPHHPGEKFKVIASSGDGWDHVSMSLPNRTPTWREMGFLYRLFFKDCEFAVQFHVPSIDHVNYHPYCLHLWRPLHENWTRPPSHLVGPK
jgi:hypothetical protein